MNSVKIAINIKKIKDSEGKEALKATIPAKAIFEKDFEPKKINEELKEFEGKYLRLVDSLKSIIKLIKSRERKGKVLLYWMFGDEIQEFIEENKDGAFLVENLTAHLVRDTSISEKMINRCRKFRAYYPDISKIELTKYLLIAM